MLNFVKKPSGLVRQRGFTLVEMIIVMAILGVVMMATMSMFIPISRSTSVQTQVSDVQSNLRLALDRMTQDFLVAGFLVNPLYDAGGTLAPGAIYWEGGDPATDLTIRTRTIGNAFARITSNDNAGKLGLSDVDMLSSFPVGTSVRIYAPMSAMEAAGVGAPGYNENLASYYDDYVSTVTSNDPTPVAIDGIACPGSITVDNFGFPTGTLKEAVVLKVKDDAQPPMQTIRYRVIDGTLQRIVNGTTTQLLARNVAAVEFVYVASPSGAAVKRVDITLTGQAVSLAGGSAESSPKERSLFSSVALRNVY